MIACSYEDRKSAEPGVRLLVASLARHSPQIPLVLCYPPADAAFRAWVARFPNVRFAPEALPDGLGWDVKPRLLLRLLRQGHDDVVWIDSDIILTRDFAPVFAGLDRETLGVAEEALWGRDYADFRALRARAWNFPVGRVLPFCLNTGVIRVTGAHEALLRDWDALMRSPEYLAAQKLPLTERPVHLVGDQDALTAMLCGEAHAGVPLRLLRRGREILQIFGLKCFTVRERLQALRHGAPAFIHAQQFKPWRVYAGMSGARKVYLDTSPYTMAAGRYRDELGENAAWLAPRSRWGRLLLRLGFGHPALAGAPIAVAVDVGYPLGKFFKQARKRLAVN